MDERDKKIGDLQKLCERAYTLIDEDFDKLRDKDGYGPMGLLKDLEKAKDGKEYKDLRSFSDMVMRRFNDNMREIENIEAERDQYREALEEIACQNNVYPDSYPVKALMQIYGNAINMAKQALGVSDGNN